MASSDKKPTFIAVHGAWHQPEHFDLVKKPLEEDGYGFYGVRLPSVGHLDADPGNALELDTTAIVEAIESVISTGRDVIIVCHSYAGLPTADAIAIVMEGHKAATNATPTGKILHLAYIASYVAEKGASLQSEHGPQDSNEPNDLDITEKGLVTNKRPVYKFYNTTSAETGNDAVSKLLPMAISAFLQPTKYCGWKDYGIPLAYISCRQDRAIPCLMQDEYVERCRAAYPRTEIWRLDCDHSPFLSMPERVVEILKVL